MTVIEIKPKQSIHQQVRLVLVSDGTRYATTKNDIARLENEI